MKKIIQIVLFILISFVIGCSDNSRNDEKKIIKIGVSPDYPPFEFRENGSIVGFDIDLIKAIVHELGGEFKIIEMSFGNLLHSLNSNDIDLVVSGLSITEEREKNFDFSREYYFENTVAVFRYDHKIDNINELKKEKIACQIGSIQEIWAKENIKNSIVSMDRNEQAIEALKAGYVNAVLIGEYSGVEFVKKNENLAYKKIYENNKGYAVVLKKGSKMTKKIDHIIQKLKENGTIAKFKVKWSL